MRALAGEHECPVELALKVIGGKWTLLILRDLLTGPKRFGELRRSLGGVSPKTLSHRLRELEEEQILTRTAFAEIPPRVLYELTPKGRSLSAVVDVIRHWGEEWLMVPTDPPSAASGRH
ncbi:MAG: helix-turn-helix transcriptional regulator [Actinomycetia bacterium]|nr:helix-turn-helix transcriptional regulator [Actinomycetes bacterium]